MIARIVFAFCLVLDQSFEVTHSLTGQALSTNITQASASSEQNTTQTKTCYQAVGADGIPLCLFCSSPVEFAARLRCSDWDKRFCSHDCKKEYQVIKIESFKSAFVTQ